MINPILPSYAKPKGNSRALWYYAGPSSVSDSMWNGNGVRTVLCSNNTSPAIYASAASLLNE